MRSKIIILIFLSIIFSSEKNKKPTNPIFTMGLSAIIPGGGQFLNGDWKKGLVFLSVELISFNQKNKYNVNAKEYIDLYEEHAEQHWSVDKWLRDFYLFKNPDYEIYQAFTHAGTDGPWVNGVQTGAYCDTSDPNNPIYCADDDYRDIWDYSHGPDFTYNNNFYSIENIASLYTEVCANSINTADDYYGASCALYNIIDANNNIYTMPWGYLQTDEYGNIIVDNDGNATPNFDNLEAVRDHHFHEGLGKYPEFFAGWEDATLETSTLDSRNGYEIPLTDKKEEFQILRNKSNSEFDKEEIYLSLIFINHAVSMFDAFLTSVNRMKKIDVNSRLKYGDNFNIRGIELSINW